MTRTWTETNPATGEELAAYTSASPSEAQQAVVECREAAAEWARETPRSRCVLLGRLRRALAERPDQVARVLSRSTGKPPVEALMGELFPTLELMTYPEVQAPRLLRSRRRATPLAFMGSRSHVEYWPYGVVAVLSPWNLPLQLSLVPLVTALAAGNGVVLKPSDVTPSVGELILELVGEVGFPPGLIQVLQGGADAGQALIDARPDLVFFTGSVEGGRRVMERAARHPVPVQLELGGKDAMLVFADAPMPRAARGAVYGSVANSGQICISSERVYVQKDLYETFLEEVHSLALTLKTGTDADADIGFLTVPARASFIRSQVREAVASGARLVTGDPDRLEQEPEPIILADVHHGMRVMREETFGPVMAVMPFASEEEGVALANDSPLGLGASVWTRDLERAGRVASRLEVGTCSVNDVFKSVGNPHLPFGGAKNSGFGRYHGPEGVYAFCRSRGVLVNPGGKSREPNWFPFHQSRYQMVRELIATLHTEQKLPRRVHNLVSFWLRTRSDRDS